MSFTMRKCFGIFYLFPGMLACFDLTYIAVFPGVSIDFFNVKWFLQNTRYNKHLKASGTLLCWAKKLATTLKILTYHV